MSDYDIVIKPDRKSKNYLSDLVKYKDLLFMLAWRDILVRYKQTVMGILWAVIRPLLTMIIFTIIFGKVANLPSESSAPYAIMVFSALLPWQFFSNGFSACSNSLVANAGMLSKIYFPRLILPVSSIITALVDFLISFLILISLMVYYSFIPSGQIIYLPIFILLIFMIVFSSGVLISALNVEYRDFKHIIPFLIQFGLYVSPVGFSSSVVPEKYQILYSLNPMVGVIDGFRWCILGTDTLNIESILISSLITVILSVYSIFKFRSLERTFADKI